MGDESYKYRNFLPYFQRSANFTPSDAAQRPQNATAQYNASDWSPTGGPLQVGYSEWVNPVSSWLGLAFQELGLKELPSLLSGTLIGWSWLTLTLDPVTQTRSSSEVFLIEALKETVNLLVYKSTLVKKINFENGSAIGVTVDSGGVTYNISARKEVILSAGVVCAVCSTLAMTECSLYCRLDAIAADAHGIRYRAERDAGWSWNSSAL